MMPTLRVTRTAPEPEPRLDCDAYVFGSGKGGVGKSLLAAMLACALARRGRRTLLVDGAQNLGNQHVLFAVRPAARMEEWMRGECAVDDLVTPISGHLDLVPTDSGTEALYGLDPLDRARIHQRLTALWGGYDAVVVDAGQGLESAVRAAGLRAARLTVVATPDPAALSDAYALIKLAHLQVPHLTLGVMVNRVAADDDPQAVFERLQLATHRFLERDLVFDGAVAESDELRRMARQPGAVRNAVCPGIEALAERWMDRNAGGVNEGLQAGGLPS